MYTKNSFQSKRKKNYEVVVESVSQMRRIEKAVGSVQKPLL